MDEDERTCLDCTWYQPASVDEATEFGICLNDEAFDPVADDLLEGRMDEACRELVEQKRFIGERPACEAFERAEMWEIDDDSPLGREITRLAEKGELDPEKLAQLIVAESFDAIDWTTVPVEQHEARLESGSPEERESALLSLDALASMGNRGARDALVRFLKALPPPATLAEVHFKVKVLERMDREKTQDALVPHLVEELYRTPSNNTTRQWISAVFRFLERAPLERMLRDKRFSHRLKKKVKQILYGPRPEWDGF